ncbi:hypothetical protein [Halosimplex salinum]|uniref:hypothetical protein n=1 Tax=Halosimplex salinum TaxID=1710538 RepID=UPI000F46E642|nr:hypothetical protein [Halosimplex salinum]
MKETDLPCSECGAQVVERIAFTADLPVDGRGSVRVAECLDCGARYYPNQTVRQLARQSTDARRRRTAER